MRKILIFVILLFSLPLAGQGAQSPVIVDAGTQSLDLNPGLWFIEDSELAFDQADLLTPEFNALFHPTDKKTPNFGFSNSAWWARIPLHNRSQQPLPFLISEGYALVDRIEYWLVDPTQRIIAQGMDGDNVESGGRDVRLRCVSDTRTESNSLMRYNVSPGGFDHDHDREKAQTIFHS